LKKTIAYNKVYKGYKIYSGIWVIGNEGVVDYHDNDDDDWDDDDFHNYDDDDDLFGTLSVGSKMNFGEKIYVISRVNGKICVRNGIFRNVDICYVVIDTNKGRKEIFWPDIVSIFREKEYYE